MDQIPTVQNEEAQLKLLRARKQTYAHATALMIVQLALTVAVPVIGGVLAAFYPDLRVHVAAVALAVIVIDVLFLDRQQKVLIKRAAKIGEQFDCAVLGLPWDHFTVGDKVEAEDIHAVAKAHAARHDDGELRGWYPEAVGEVPLHFARIICQRTNLRYDSRLRRSYGDIIKVVAACVVGLLFVSGLVQNLSMTAWVLVMAPATPILAWAAREYYRQLDTAELLDTLMKEARKLWNQALSGECDAAGCEVRSREFQNAIYNRRANSPLVLPLLYRFRRSALEDEMNVGAAELLREYARSQAAQHCGT